MPRLTLVTLTIAVALSVVTSVLCPARDALHVAIGGGFIIASMGSYMIIARVLAKGAWGNRMIAYVVLPIKTLVTLSTLYAVVHLGGNRGVVFFLVGYMSFLPATVMMALARKSGVRGDAPSSMS